MSQASLKQEMLAADETFRNLFEQHQSFEQKLLALHHKSFLSPDDESEIKRIKFRKLELKDRMAQMMLEHQRADAAVSA